MSVVPHSRQLDSPDIQLGRQHRWIILLKEAADLAHAIANTSFVPKAMRGDEAAITATILYGDEVGLQPMQSLSKIAVIDGKPSLAAEAQRALILAAGHQMWVEDAGTTRATLAGKRHDQDQVQRVTWTMDDAKRAGLAGKQNWRQYPRAMLVARASAELARGLFADVIGGLAATEELEDTAPDGSAAVESEAPPAATTRRRRAPRTQKAVIAPTLPTAPEPPAPPLPDEPDDQPPKASDMQLRKMFALFGQLGLRDRDQRLKWAADRLGRELETANDLTDIEASTLIDALEQEAADQEPAPEPEEADAEPEGEQQELIHQLSPSKVSLLQWARREAGVDDQWLRVQLIDLGLRIPPGPVRIGTIRSLTDQQADRLQAALDAIVDERKAEMVRDINDVDESEG